MTTERRKAIVDMYYDQGLEVDAIALKVPSPRGPGSVCSRTFTNVLEHYAFFGHVEKLPRKKRERAMPPHIRELLCCIAEEKPWLFQATGNIAVSRVPPPPHVRILANFIRLLPLASYCADATREKGKRCAESDRDTPNPQPTAVYWLLFF